MFPTRTGKPKEDFTLTLSIRGFFLEKENRWVTLKVSAAGIRTINKLGLEEALKEAQGKGLINIY